MYIIGPFYAQMRSSQLSTATNTTVVPRIIELKGIDPETAFVDAQTEARHLFGNSRTTGTLADADGHIIVSGPALLYWDARRAAQQLLRDGHARPGGPAFLLRLADPGRTKTVKVTVDVTGLLPGQADDAIDAAIREKMPDDEWGVHTVELRYQDAEGDERKGVTKTRVSLSPGKGGKVTKFVVRNEASNAVLSEHPTLSAARLWMRDALQAGAAAMVCVGEVSKEEGPLLRGENLVLKKTVVVVATIAKPAPGGSGAYLASGLFPVGA